MDPAKVGECAVAVSRHTSICGLQEIQVGEDTQVVEAALPRWWRLIGTEGTSPIALNQRRWVVLSANSTRTRRPHLSRVENPYLDITAVAVRSHKRPNLPPFAVVNTHLVSGGYNAQHLPDVARQWDREFTQLESVVHDWRIQGLTVYVVGDLNHHRPPEMLPARRFAWLTPTGQPDHVGQLVDPSSVQLKRPTHQALRVPSDHKLHVVTGPLRRA
jgi:hypothetical protein